jgi:hypothetical protein
MREPGEVARAAREFAEARRSRGKVSTTIVVQVEERAEPERGERGTDGHAARDAKSVARQLGVALRPMHPGIRDPALASYLVAEVTDPTEAERIAARLRSCADVKAAYVKPADQLP